MKIHIDIKKLFFSAVLMCMFASLAYAQEESVEGNVVSPDGKAIENAKVSVKEEPQKEVYTDNTGAFVIDAKEGQHLVIEIDNKYRKVVSLTSLDENEPIVLDRGSELIENGFNNTVRAEELTTAIGHSFKSDMVNVTAHTPGEILYGQIPGLRVFQNTGHFPNERLPSMDIRGISTLQNSDILVLVDGVERPLNNVVPEEIESISVLKDAAAKARYGQRGANGVLIVNTKRGNVGPTRFMASYERGVTQPTHLPEFLNAANYARAVNEALTNDLIPPRYSVADIQKFESGESPYLWPNVNWVDEVLKGSGQFSRTNFSAIGGSESVRFYLGLNYQNEEGLYKNTEAFKDFSTQLDYDKLNFRTNIDVDLTPSTQAMVNLAGYIRSNQGPANWNVVDETFSVPSLAFPVRNLDGSWGGDNLYNVNPVAEIMATGFNLTNSRSFQIDLQLKQNLNSVLKGLSAEIFSAYDNRASFFENSTKSYLFNEFNPVLDENGVILDTLVTQLGEDSDLDPSRSPGDLQTTHYDVRGKLNYSNVFGNHSIDSWLMFQQEQMDLRGNNNTFRYQNIAANVHYGLMNKYFVDATVSYYGTNRIQGPTQRFGLFPAVSAGWLLHKENFMSYVSQIDFLKLTASYGKVGNGLITINNLTDAQYGYVGGAYVFGENYNSVNGQEEQNIPVQEKKYEASVESNIGIQTRLFNNLEFNASYFYQKRSDIMVSSIGQYSAVLGIFPEQVPSGVIENKGYEIDLTWRDEIGDFTYFIGGQFSQYNSEIINMNEPFQPFDYMKREGKALSQYFGWESNGFYADQNDIDNSPTSQFGTVRPGDIKYVDQNKDGVIDEFDVVALDNTAIPQIYYSSTIGFGYKGFQITALFQGAAKSSAYLNQPDVFWPLQNNTGNISTWYTNYWTPANQANAELPRLTTEANNNNFRRNDIWIRDNSFLKLRFAEVSYLFANDFLQNLKVQNIRLYLRGRNLFTMDKIDYVDPENTWSSYPTLRMYNFGVNVTF